MTPAVTLVCALAQADLQVHNARLEEQAQERKGETLPSMLHPDNKRMQCLSVPLKPLVVESSGKPPIVTAPNMLAILSIQHGDQTTLRTTGALHDHTLCAELYFSSPLVGMNPLQHWRQQLQQTGTVQECNS